MQDSIREMIEEREAQMLGPYAALSRDSEGRPEPEAADPIRTCFQRDRDRILHSKPFRRLKHKTQVFILPAGDHLRTRLTHSLEVAQIARTIGRALRLNEDLIEAIALGHDVGHTPFGHAGEAAMDGVLQARFAGNTQGIPERFSHSEQSLRVVDVLARLNLSQETRAGIGGHSKGRGDLSAHDGQPTSTLEAAVVRIADRIAYMSHDLDDALRARVIPEVPATFAHLGSKSGERIASMVHDCIDNSLDRPALTLSPRMLSTMNDLKDWLFENVYLDPRRQHHEVDKAHFVVRNLMDWYLQPGHLPEGFDGAQGAIDYVAGMTDRFAIRDFTEKFVPTEFTELVDQVR